MALIDFDKFLASFITEMKECSQMRNFSIPRCIKKALVDQGLDYKGGEIIKTQCRISAEAKENGYQTDDGILDHKAAITAVKKLYGQKSAAWSEEDEETLDSILNDIKQRVIPDENDVQWLKSLKNRIKGE